MARIAFLLMAHKAPLNVAEQVRMLVAQGDSVAVHFDANAAWGDWLALVEALAGLPRVRLLRNRVRGGWGTWSLVEASLRLMRAAVETFPEATHFYLISGDCMPIRPRTALAAQLDSADRDYIEHHDFLRSEWIKTGLKAERLIYRHPFNERRQTALFYAGLWLQQSLGLTRKTPKGMTMRIGSQWWCLRRRTVETVLGFCERTPKVVRFFRTVWIPDEVFFQTLVPHLVPEAEIEGHPLTRLMFSDYGMPVTFHGDQADLLLRQSGFFVRKLADGAGALRARLVAHYGAAEAPGIEGPDLVDRYRWLAGRGREGRATPPPPWARVAPQVTVVVCKKWHVAHRVARRAAAETGRLALPSVFDEVSGQDPDLGGYGRTLEARRADPVRYLTRAAEARGARAVLVCVDPCRIEVIRALPKARVLRLDCAAEPAFAAAHSHRIGLQGDLQGAVAAEMLGELAALDRLGPEAATVIAPSDPVPLCARHLSQVLDISEGLALELGAQLELGG